MRNKIGLILLAVLAVISGFAQETTNESSTSGVMASEGKIYVVVAVVLTILFGLIYYVTRLDKKIGKLEKEHRM